MPPGNIFVVDSYNHRIQKFSSDGTFLTKWGTFGSGNGQFNYPGGVAVDAAGNVYITDTFNNRVQKFDPAGTFLATWGTAGSADGQFASPTGIAVDASGNVYVGEYGNNRVQKFALQAAVKALPGVTSLPTDPDHDGLYEDLNGNGEAGFSRCGPVLQEHRLGSRE